MFATQLLRILEVETSPTDVKGENCVCDSAAQDMMIMKENQDGAHYDSKYLGRDSDPMPVRSKETDHPSPFDVKGTEVYWNPKLDDDLSTNRNGHLKGDEFQNGPLCRQESLEDDIDSVSSDTNAKDEVQNTPEHDNENKSSDCMSPYVATASDLFGRDKHLYMDKNVLEYQRPELVVCYKELNYHVVKDICVDEGMPANRRILIDNVEDGQSGNCFPHPQNDHSNHAATGGVEDEFLISNVLEAATSLEDSEFVVANQQGSNEIFLVQGQPNSQSERSSFKDTATGCYLEESIQEDGMDFGATSETATHAPDVESFVDETLPIQEFGTRSFLRSFLSAFDADGNELPDQQFSEGPAATSTEARPKEDVQKSSLKYNSQVETRSITFNFNSLGATSGETELIKEHPVDSREVIESEIPSDTRQRGQPQDSSINDMNNNNNALDQSLDCKDDRAADNGPVVSLRRYDPGESSFSADSYITHSGPIAFSGNVSLRSDGSATSGRSFAFPVLQSEWNSSPVRMTEAERRRFRKHKCWRSGILCCRF
ncbi:uncharacterized protein LOC125211381 isoform X1 [Salvia hispanica]|uniref:uncharacterized protein LOC125211381 isoform X1 n=1 Tax=Salvia hispanica TaxID=49212 RepID=UPI0020090365|nr:uncharacterized protein LOC125211381 isoform X1 [Salvia hispanica]XP_047967095.1 uncharacterized protein LOC125211381 isoform X1 [Salvia hispanica]XP_047967096.1 uncharacterized protein LOC125211381 isoform X1 [Salvia hispanica]XP_047967097.1 uncharacterized protein LOC125211381 isoform X1 [Salvia hispanica]